MLLGATVGTDEDVYTDGVAQGLLTKSGRVPRVPLGEVTRRRRLSAPATTQALDTGRRCNRICHDRRRLRPTHSRREPGRLSQLAVHPPAVADRRLERCADEAIVLGVGQELFDGRRVWEWLQVDCQVAEDLGQPHPLLALRALDHTAGVTARRDRNTGAIGVKAQALDAATARGTRAEGARATRSGHGAPASDSRPARVRLAQLKPRTRTASLP